MEATRPTPINLARFKMRQTRDDVLEKLGMPPSSALASDGADCDFYRLYTRGYGAGGKIPIALAEGTADLFTLGMAEVVTTPVEGITKNELHPVTFCYRNNLLVRVSRPTGSGTQAAPSAGIPDGSAAAAVSRPPPEPAPVPVSAEPGADSVPDSSQTE